MKATFFLALLVLMGCATYQGKVESARDSIANGNLEEALTKLKPLAEKPGDDQLIYLLDYATTLQISGKFTDSTKYFLKADKLADIQDYHSVSNVAMAALGSEEMIQYKGESYEKVLINAFLAINFLMEGKNDDALVEVRRVNEKINKFRKDGREDYELNPFSHYLSGLIWESERKFDDAYIEFESAYKLDPLNPFIKSDLLRSAKLARRAESYKKWKSEFGSEAEDQLTNGKAGELIIIFQQGWGPRKTFAPGNHRFPRLYLTPSETQSIRVTANGKSYDSKRVYDVSAVAIKTLQEDYAWMAARKIGAFAAKEIVADQIRQKNEALGLVALLTMHLSDRADLRQWSTLPQTVQLVRIPVSAGPIKISAIGLNQSGQQTSEFWETTVNPTPGKKTFYNMRSLK